MRRKEFDDPDLPVSELMGQWPETIMVFLRHEMHCVGCLIGPFHTVTDACIEYGLNEDQFVEELGLAVTRAGALR